MKVLLITANYPPLPCGIGDYTCRLAEEIHLGGAETCILTSAAEREGSTGRGVSVFGSVRRWDDSFLPEVLELVQNRSIPLAHIQYQPNGFQGYSAIARLPGWLKKRAGKSVKVVTTLHELAGPRRTSLPGPLGRLWLIPLILRSDGLIVTNERDFSLLRRVPFLRRRLRKIPLAPVISPGRLPATAREEARKELGVQAEEILLVRFGLVHNLRASRIQDFLRAAGRLAAGGHLVRLLFLGGTNHDSPIEIRRMANDLGLADRVIFSGFCSPAEVSRFLAAADIAIQLYPGGVSEKRTALLTVMAHGLPVVSTQKGAVPHPFRTLENILLVPDRDPERTAAAIGRLIADRAFRERLCSNSAAVMSRFDWKSIGQAHIEFYRSLAGR